MVFKPVFDMLFAPVILVVKFFTKLFNTIPALFLTLINTFVYFVTNFIPLLIKGIQNIGIILQSIFYYLQNPTKIFSLLIQLLIFIPLMMISILYHIPIENKYKLGDFFMYWICGGIFSTAFLIVTIVYYVVYKIVIEYFILGGLDKITKGAISTFYYKYLLACENPPDSWYETANYHHLNKNTKILFFAYNKCPTGFIPNGIFCEKKPTYNPDYCEEAHIYKHHGNEEQGFNSGLLFPKEFNQNSQSYLKKKSFDKMIDIEDYTNNVKEHVDTCKKVHKNKDTLIKSICKDISNVEKSNDLKTLCKRRYCVNEQQPFCHIYNDHKVVNRDNVERNPFSQLLILVIFIMMITIVSLKYNKNT